MCLLDEIELATKVQLELVRELLELDPLRSLGAPSYQANRRAQHREVELA